MKQEFLGMTGRYRTGVLSVTNGGLRSGPPCGIYAVQGAFLFSEKGGDIKAKTRKRSHS